MCTIYFNSMHNTQTYDHSALIEFIWSSLLSLSLSSSSSSQLLLSYYYWLDAVYCSIPSSLYWTIVVCSLVPFLLSRWLLLIRSIFFWPFWLDLSFMMIMAMMIAICYFVRLSFFNWKIPLKAPILYFFFLEMETNVGRHIKIFGGALCEKLTIYDYMHNYFIAYLHAWCSFVVLLILFVIFICTHLLALRILFHLRFSLVFLFRKIKDINTHRERERKKTHKTSRGYNIL